MEKPNKFSQVAIIREAECIGCTKCIQACPVDAILGSSTLMHTVIADECIACHLCVPACPVDCIEMVAVSKPRENIEAIAKQAKQRFHFRKQRLEDSAEESLVILDDAPNKQAYLTAALERARIKKCGG